MRAVLLEVPQDLLDDRRRKGLDVFDEMWEGVLHMVPQPTGPHQRFAFRLGVVLDSIAKSKGLLLSHETGLYRADGDDNDYRVPDLSVYRPESASDRGIDGRTELAVEVRSPNDETYDKLGFYAAVEVQELLVVDINAPSIELFVLSGGQLEPATADAAGALRLSSVGVTISLRDAGPVRIDWDEATFDIPLQSGLAAC